MASQSASPEWTWCPHAQDHYYEVWDSRTKILRRIWGKDHGNTTPRAFHASPTTGFPGSSSAVQTSGGFTRPSYSMLNKNEVHGTSVPSRNVNYAHQPIPQGPNRAESSGHHRYTSSHSSHNSISGNHQGGLSYNSGSPPSQPTYFNQNTPITPYPAGRAYGSSQGWSSAGHVSGTSPEQGQYPSQQASRISSSFNSALGYSHANFAEYKIMPPPSWKHFTVGKVFITYHIENAGPDANPSNENASNFTSVLFGERAHHQFRRFVVVRTPKGDLFSQCCPITTYSGKATTKDGVNQKAHTIVYSGNNPPEKLPGETQMNKDPLRIILENPMYKLDPKSRINLSKTFPIDHNRKILMIGTVDALSLPKLLHYVESLQRA